MTSEKQIEYITVYKEVKVPVSCKIERRERPNYENTKSLKELLNDILLYTELLEADTNYCRGYEDESVRESKKER